MGANGDRFREGVSCNAERLTVLVGGDSGEVSGIDTSGEENNSRDVLLDELSGTNSEELVFDAALLLGGVADDEDSVTDELLLW